MAKKKRNSKTASGESRAVHRCERHPDRIASISTGLKGRCCWECYLPADVFERRYGAGYAKIYGHRFYDPEGPGHAGNEPEKKGRN